MWRHFFFLVWLFLIAGQTWAQIQTQVLEYEVAGQIHRGFAAWDQGRKDRRPLVLVIHEWWGLDDYARRRATMLAEQGYLAVAVDMYGQGRTTSDPRQAGAWAVAVRRNPQALALLDAATEAAGRLPVADLSRRACLGYCFGGSMTLAYARSGADLQLAASFHGNLATDSPAQPGAIKGQVLVLHGADDTFEPPAVIAAFIEEMRRAGADWQLVYYGGALHSFTNPQADSFNIPGVAYQQKADQRSWRLLLDSLREVFPDQP